MRTALQPAVPSRRLLRFLRFQSQGIPYFSPSHACAVAAAAAHSVQAAGLDCRRSSIAKNRPSSTTATTTTTTAITAVQTGLPKPYKIVRAASTGLSSARDVAATRRFASTDQSVAKERAARASERLWGPNTVNPDFRSRNTDDLETSIFTTSMTGRRAKAALEPVLRCTEVDDKGEAILTDGAFKKTELIAKYGLMPRDLRKIDSSNLPHILVRPSAILLNLLHLRVLIKHDRVLLFDVYGSTTSSAQSEFMYELQGKLRQKQAPGTTGGLLPYEFRALEVVLMSVTSELWKDFSTVQDPVMHLLVDLEQDVDREKLRLLLVVSKQISTFEQKARLVRDAIEELLEADDDLSQMYLTEKTRDIKREQDDHTEIEMLLESYHKICDEVVQEASNLVSGIRNTEEIIRAILDANRNALMLLDLKFSVGTLGLAMGTFLAGLYGMNLENFIEETDWGFGVVTGGSAFFGLLVCWFGLVRVRRLQRVRMAQPAARSRKASDNGCKNGLDPYGKTKEWYRDDSPTALLEARHREKLRTMARMKEKEKRAEATGLKKWLRRLF